MRVTNKEAREFATRDTVVKRAYKKRNPQKGEVLEGSSELEIKAAKALLSGPFFREFFEEAC